MKKSRFALFVCLVALVAFTAAEGAAFAQDLHPSRRPSPMGIARVNLGDCYASITYSRPYKRNRAEIFGGEGSLVPFGQVWRTGANEGTEMHSTCDLMVGGETLPAGSYTLFSTPGKAEWKLHFNSVLGVNGTRDYEAANDVATVAVKPSNLDEEMDQLTISFEEQENGDVHLVLAWINTELRVPVKTAG